jgi:peptidoglycan hydrolase-like protein with peptidoglycan-binding domain
MAEKASARAPEDGGNEVDCCQPGFDEVTRDEDLPASEGGVAFLAEFSLTWLPEVLKAAGLKVATIPGWEGRGHGNVGQILGVLCHHTAGPKSGNLPSLNTLVNGRTGLPGPVANLGLGRDGTYFVIAAGKAHHAGNGDWKGLTNGNTNFIGIEAENTGLPNDSPWPAVQMDAYRRGVAAILAHVGRGVEFCAGHKEYALPPGRKPDPNFDMAEFRSSVAAVLSGAIPPPPLIPQVEPPPSPGAPSGRPTLRRGASGALVGQVQEILGVPADRIFGPRTEAALRAFQRLHSLVDDGIIGPKTWAALDKEALSRMPPVRLYRSGL